MRLGFFDEDNIGPCTCRIVVGLCIFCARARSIWPSNCILLLGGPIVLGVLAFLFGAGDLCDLNFGQYP